MANKNKITIKGIKELKRELKKSITFIAPIAGESYKEQILKNLEPSVKTGALIRSWRIKNTLLKSTVSSDLPYAAIQNYGGRIRITELMRKKMWVLYKQFGLGVYKAIALTKKTFITIPAKKYLDIDMIKFSRDINKQFAKITKKI